MACPRILLALLLVVHIKTHAQLILPGASQPIVFGDRQEFGTDWTSEAPINPRLLPMHHIHCKKSI